MTSAPPGGDLLWEVSTGMPQAQRCGAGHGDALTGRFSPPSSPCSSYSIGLVWAGPDGVDTTLGTFWAAEQEFQKLNMRRGSRQRTTGQSLQHHLGSSSAGLGPCHTAPIPTTCLLAPSSAPPPSVLSSGQAPHVYLIHENPTRSPQAKSEHMVSM